jgi:uncharacterized BrkB/YihY/UPF0761 family membrane protein
MKMKNLVRILIGTALILLVPLVAMQFSDDVDWSITDFVTIGILLLGAGLLYELAAAKTKPKYRAALAAAFIAIVLVIWAELAVGIFGTPFAGS